VLAKPVSTALQQLLAQPLPLQKLELSTSMRHGRSPVLHVTLPTQLTELCGGVSSCVLAKDVLLPTQLQRLKFTTWSGADSLAPIIRLQRLQQMKRLCLQVDFAEQWPLLQLAQLPALQHLTLVYDGVAALERAAASATASAWALLPQLQALDLRDVPVGLHSQHEVAGILAGVAAATSLTKLVWIGSLAPASDAVSQTLDAVACMSLTGLTRLKDLTVSGGNIMKSAFKEGWALTALTSLTRLKFEGRARGVATSAAAAVAQSLQKLQHLDWSGCELRLGTAKGAACLQAIGRLTLLTYLDLSYNHIGSMQHKAFLQLTGLPRLQHLGLC
jgi:hypothetical protein